MTTLTLISRQAACNAVVDQLDGGSVEWQTSAGAVIAVSTLPTPAFGAADASAVAAMNAVADANVTAAGTVAKAVWKTSAAAIAITSTVTGTGGGGNIELTSLTYAVGDKIKFNSYNHSQPA